jgi:hypothetical protein
MSAAAGIIHLDGVVQTVALDNPAVLCLPPAPATTTRARRLGSYLLRIGEAGKRASGGKPPSDAARSGLGRGNAHRLLLIHARYRGWDFASRQPAI